MKIAFSKKILVFLVIFLVGAGAGVGGTFLKAKIFPVNNDKTASSKKAAEEIGPFIELKEFIVNLEGGGMIRTEITLEGVDKKSEGKITAKEIFLRDRIISVLGSKGIDDIRDPQGRENLKKELVTELNKVCEDKIKDVLFKSFIYSI